MNDRQRYEFAGQPELCLACGSVMKVFETAKTMQIVCPKYGGAMSLHEFYRFEKDEPGLGSPALLWSVGAAGPAKRIAIYTTVVFAAVMAIVLIIMRLLA